MSPRENNGESSSSALVELLLDVGDLLPHRFQIIEDGAELRFGDVFRLAGADRLLGRLEQLVDGLAGDTPTARAVEQFTDLIGMFHKFARGQSDLADQFLCGGEKRFAEDVGIFGEDAIEPSPRSRVSSFLRSARSAATESTTRLSSTCGTASAALSERCCYAMPGIARTGFSKR